MKNSLQLCAEMVDNMRLRKLKRKDAPYMLEWMKDSNVVQYMRSDFSNKTMNDCEEFIEYSWKDKFNKHWAIVSARDEYMGTVSLKNIEDDEAEFAIAIRSCAMGKGYSKYAMEKCIQYAFEKMKLKKVYWYVSMNNMRAIRFYEKNGYQLYNGIKEENILELNKDVTYKWYAIYNL